MHWYQSIEQKILSWRAFRNGLTGQNPLEDLLAVQQFWYGSPWRKVSLLRDDHESWPDPWHLLESPSFCDLSRSLGMFYTINLSPGLKHLDAQLIVLYSVDGERTGIVEIDQGKYILNFNPDQLVNTDSVNKEFNQRMVFTTKDFKALN
jgi:hypothetical protein